MIPNSFQDIPFAAMWKAHNPQTLDEARAFWDNRADEFNDITRARDKEERLELVAWLEARGALAKGARVLDLGCGAGRYALEFAKRAGHVTGLDISPRMITFARNNAAEAGADNVTFEALAWQDIDLADRGWEGAFDLAFASMSPAIESEETLLKFHASSRRHCFMNGFIFRRDILRQTLMERILPGRVEPPYRGSIIFAFTVLWQQGIYADVLCKDVQWTNSWDMDTALAAYQKAFQAFIPDERETRRLLAQELESLMQNGRVERLMMAKTAWLYWQKQERGA